MVQNYFEEVLEELAVDIEIPGLHPDKKNTCLIFWQKKAHLYVQFDQEEKNLLIVGKIGEVPLGRFRENVFRLALQMNGVPLNVNQPHGIFAFSEKSLELIFFTSHPKESLKREKIKESFLFIASKSMEWKEAIEKGSLPSLNSNIPSSGGGMFGLK